MREVLGGAGGADLLAGFVVVRRCCSFEASDEELGEHHMRQCVLLLWLPFRHLRILLVVDRGRSPPGMRGWMGFHEVCGSQ